MNNYSERLKKLRLEKGLTLEEVHKKTKVHLNILRALEGDSITHLNPVYLQGFLKIYCQFLGVDFKEYMSEHKEVRRKEPEPAAVKPAPVKPVVSAVKPVETATKSAPFEAPKVPEFFKNASVKLGNFRPNENVKKALVFVAIGIVLVFGISKIAKFISSRRAAVVAQPKIETKKEIAAVKPQAKTAATEVKPQAKSANTVASAQNTDASSQQKSTAVKKDISEIRLVLKARDNCWVTLKVDGKTVFRRVLEKGRSESWKAKERMDLAVGNAGAVELEVDGQLFSNLGRKGQSLNNIVITRKGLDIGK